MAKIELSQYEEEALKEGLEKYTDILDGQIKEVKKSRRLSGDRQKEIRRSLEKKRNLLQDILKRL